MRENYNSNALTIKFLQQMRNFVDRYLKKGKFANFLRRENITVYSRWYCTMIDQSAITIGPYPCKNMRRFFDWLPVTKSIE
jgi:hypothetical protein